jgi:hypothetical protein
VDRSKISLMNCFQQSNIDHLICFLLCYKTLMSCFCDLVLYLIRSSVNKDFELNIDVQANATFKGDFNSLKTKQQLST